ncbi:uncharacterized protein LOC120849598 [Ixodes scapularis]|uniref:uncharacterized protein LOC120849598 n=1 Tax=Ixodes scapularis TaxID=6945 RepID=UPI001A9FDC57|nr:uncharacterized protein LOC120849598 [Ixodes scapularis]
MQEMERKNQDEKTAWRCAKYWTNNCKAAVLTKHGKVVKTTQEHNHPPDSSQLREARLKNALKQRVRSEPHLPAPQVYSREILSLVGQVDDTVMAELPTFESVRSSMYREKRKQQPSLPRDMAEINLGRLHTETLDKRDFLLFDVSISEGRVLCFCTQELLFHFSEMVEVFFDGTFFSCPSLFYQLVTISAVKEGLSFNIAYFLLPGKSREVYVSAFTNFKTALDALRAPLSLSVVRTDFELALIQAFLFVFPGIRHQGCHFHFAQAIWRKVQELGLAKAYQEDSSPLESQLILYFEDTWLLGNYDTQQWNHHQNSGARTNNLKEAWHRKINNAIGKAHPNVYTFVEHIKRDEATSRVTLLQVSNGGQARKRQKKWEMKDEAIRKLEQRLSNGELNIQEFLRLVQRYCGI